MDPMTGTESRLNDGYRRLQAFRHRHHKAEIAAFFAAGFLFDAAMVSRIDDAMTLVQQGAYVAILAWLMALEERHRAGIAPPPRLLAKAWGFSEDAIHFLFGTLLNQFALLYVKSSSGLSSFLFILFLGALLVANEMRSVRRHGPIVRFALLSLCLTSYFAVLLPVLAGFISPWLFVSAVALSCGALYGLVRKILRWRGDALVVFERVAAPAVAMQVLLVTAYFAGAIPPVPLSVQFIGIYHEVVPPGHDAAAMMQMASMTGGAPPADRTYQLKHLRPWWKVWQTGDQDFAARPGDVVYCFARVFAPNRFRDAIYVHWWLKGPKGGWADQGRAQLTISGGRGDGFRAYATKKNYQPGRWRVAIETEDGRGIGVIKFDITNDPSTETREFAIDHA
jgi:hypothetical protein